MERSPEELKAHYELERELADRLRAADRRERARLYVEVYEELFRRAPTHPQIRPDPGRRRRILERNMAIVRSFLRPDMTFVELGAGDAAVTMRAAPLCREAVAVDVTDALVTAKHVPRNFRFVSTDGLAIPLPDRSADLVFSCQVMEHLHPDDAREQVAEIVRVLRPRGRCICITPNRIFGPHDISRFFDETATGLHLKEYTWTELARLFAQSGFAKVRALGATSRGVYRWPLRLIARCERILEGVPAKRRRRVAGLLPVKALLCGSNIRLMGVK